MRYPTAFARMLQILGSRPVFLMLIYSTVAINRPHFTIDDRIAARISPQIRAKTNPPSFFSPRFIGIEGTSDERASAPNFSNFTWQRVTFCFASPQREMDFLAEYTYTLNILYAAYLEYDGKRYLGFANFANEPSRAYSSFPRAFLFAPQQRESTRGRVRFLNFFFSFSFSFS